MQARSRRTLVAAGAVAALAVAGAGAALLLHDGGTSAASPPADTACPRDASGVKPALAGVLAIGAPPATDDPSVLGGLSVNVDWADLQPAPGGPLVHPNAVDDAVALVRRQGGCSRGLKLRVLAGVHSPAWALGLGGAPVQLSSSGQQALAGSVPRFWTDAFGAAYDDLQRRLADAYDDVPEVREVVMSRCTTFYAEPLLRQVDGTGGNSAAYTAAGLDQARDEACLTAQTRAHEVWRHTRSSLALNPYVAPGAATARAGTDLPLRVARDCRDVLRERCVLANNSVRWPVLTGLYPQLYAGMVALGPPLEFQTAASNRIGDVAQTVRWAAQQGAGSLEMEPKVIDGSASELAALAAADQLPGAAALRAGH